MAEDIDVGVNRSQTEINEWRREILSVVESLKCSQLVDDNEVDQMISEIKLNIDNCWEKALEADFPSSDKLLSRVYRLKTRVTAQRHLVLLNICPQIMTKPCNRSGLWSPWYVGSSMTNLDKSSALSV